MIGETLLLDSRPYIRVHLHDHFGKIANPYYKTWALLLLFSKCLLRYVITNASCVSKSLDIENRLIIVLDFLDFGMTLACSRKSYHIVAALKLKNEHILDPGFSLGGP